MKKAIGIDLGGTRIKVVLTDEAGNLLHREYADTCDDVDAVWKPKVAEIVTVLQQQLTGEPHAIGISAPGLPNKENTAIAYMPGRMPGLENFVWRDLLGQPVAVLNDAVAALIGEAKTGAAKNCNNAILVTLGTGVGGALLINGKPYQGSFNKAGHIGHMVVDETGEKDVTGMPGSLEECIGNCSISRRSKGRFESTRDLLTAYRQGDSFAADIWLISVRRLALALASVSNFLSPDTIVIGGGIAESDNDLFDPLNKWFDEFEWQPGGIRPKIVKAMQGDMAGAIGVASFALAQQQ
ncbi:MAG TPA: ROK family protein [Flavihumibacter sp.]|nr:ROK family protein [Flavihumibacter sp.]